MQRYFFDHHEGEIVRDDVGVLFGSCDAAIAATMA